MFQGLELLRRYTRYSEAEKKDGRDPMSIEDFRAQESGEPRVRQSVRSQPIDESRRREGWERVGKRRARTYVEGDRSRGKQKKSGQEILREEIEAIVSHLSERERRAIFGNSANFYDRFRGVGKKGYAKIEDFVKEWIRNREEEVRRKEADFKITVPDGLKLVEKAGGSPEAIAEVKGRGVEAERAQHLESVRYRNDVRLGLMHGAELVSLCDNLTRDGRAEFRLVEHVNATQNADHHDIEKVDRIINNISLRDLVKDLLQEYDRSGEENTEERSFTVGRIRLDEDQHKIIQEEIAERRKKLLSFVQSEERWSLQKSLALAVYFALEELSTVSVGQECSLTDIFSDIYEYFHENVNKYVLNHARLLVVKFIRTGDPAVFAEIDPPVQSSVAVETIEERGRREISDEALNELFPPGKPPEGYRVQYEELEEKQIAIFGGDKNYEAAFAALQEILDREAREEHVVFKTSKKVGKEEGDRTVFKPKHPSSYPLWENAALRFTLSVRCAIDGLLEPERVKSGVHRANVRSFITNTTGAREPDEGTSKDERNFYNRKKFIQQDLRRGREFEIPIDPDRGGPDSYDVVKNKMATAVSLYMIDVAKAERIRAAGSTVNRNMEERLEKHLRVIADFRTVLCRKFEISESDFDNKLLYFINPDIRLFDVNKDLDKKQPVLREKEQRRVPPPLGSKESLRLWFPSISDEEIVRMLEEGSEKFDDAPVDFTTIQMAEKIMMSYGKCTISNDDLRRVFVSYGINEEQLREESVDQVMGRLEVLYAAEKYAIQKKIKKLEKIKRKGIREILSEATFVVHGKYDPKTQELGEKSDSDAECALGLFRRAGILASTKLEFVDHGKKKEGCVNIDTGYGFGIIVEEVKDPKDPSKVIDYTVVIDHHGVGSSREVSATSLTYRFLVEAGLLQREARYDALANFQDDLDNARVPSSPEDYKKSPYMVCSIGRMLTFDQLMKFFEAGRDAREVLPEKDIDIFGFRGACKQQINSIERAEEIFDRLEKESFILESPVYGKILIDIPKKITKSDPNNPAKTKTRTESFIASGGFSGARAMGCDVLVTYNPEEKSFFISSHRPFGSDFVLSQGRKVREVMYIQPRGSKSLDVTLEEILNKLIPGGFRSHGGLREYIDGPEQKRLLQQKGRAENITAQRELIILMGEKGIREPDRESKKLKNWEQQFLQANDGGDFKRAKAIILCQDARQNLARTEVRYQKASPEEKRTLENILASAESEYKKLQVELRGDSILYQLEEERLLCRERMIAQVKGRGLFRRGVRALGEINFANFYTRNEGRRFESRFWYGLGRALSLRTIASSALMGVGAYFGATYGAVAATAKHLGIAQAFTKFSMAALGAVGGNRSVAASVGAVGTYNLLEAMAFASKLSKNIKYEKTSVSREWDPVLGSWLELEKPKERKRVSSDVRDTEIVTQIRALQARSIIYGTDLTKSPEYTWLLESLRERVSEKVGTPEEKGLIVKRQVEAMASNNEKELNEFEQVYLRGKGIKQAENKWWKKKKWRTIIAVAAGAGVAFGPGLVMGKEIAEHAVNTHAVSDLKLGRSGVKSGLTSHFGRGMGGRNINILTAEFVPPEGMPITKLGRVASEVFPDNLSRGRAVSYVHEFREGDSLWKVLEEKLEEKFDGFKNISKTNKEGRAMRDNIIDSYKRIVGKNPQVFGILKGDIDNIEPGTELNLAGVLEGPANEIRGEKLISRAQNLDAQVLDKITGQREGANEFLSQNKGERFTTSKAVELFGEGGRREELPQSVLEKDLKELRVGIFQYSKDAQYKLDHAGQISLTEHSEQAQNIREYWKFINAQLGNYGVISEKMSYMSELVDAKRAYALFDKESTEYFNAFINDHFKFPKHFFESDEFKNLRMDRFMKWDLKSLVEKGNIKGESLLAFQTFLSENMSEVKDGSPKMMSMSVYDFLKSKAYFDQSRVAIMDKDRPVLQIGSQKVKKMVGAFMKSTSKLLQQNSGSI